MSKSANQNLKTKIVLIWKFYNHLWFKTWNHVWLHFMLFTSSSFTDVLCMYLKINTICGCYLSFPKLPMLFANSLFADVVCQFHICWCLPVLHLLMLFASSFCWGCVTIANLLMLFASSLFADAIPERQNGS